MARYGTPGVYPVETLLEPPVAPRTGVPAFLGYAAEHDPSGGPRTLTLASQFEALYGPPRRPGHLAAAVRGFFANGGRRCVVVPLDEQLDAPGALARGLAALESVDEADLVCAPDVVRRLPCHAGLPLPPADAEAMVGLQRAVLDHCEARGDRFAILDSLPRASPDDVLAQRGRLVGNNGALYYPWVRTAGAGEAGPFVPPSGHVAGVYALTDERVGVHKAPANEQLEGVLDVEVAVSGERQAVLNPAGVNCLRAFAGRGIRVWGTRTLSADPAWRYVSTRRLFVTAARWVERSLADLAFEPSDPSLWSHVERELTAYFNGLFRRGALRGLTAEEAFSVKCDADTNPPEEREAGRVVAEIGLAPTIPNEFVVVHLVYHAGVVSTGPARLR